MRQYRIKDAYNQIDKKPYEIYYIIDGTPLLLYTYIIITRKIIPMKDCSQGLVAFKNISRLKTPAKPN